MGVTKIPQLPEPNHKALHKFITYFLDTLEQFQRHDFMKHNGQPCHPPSRYPLCPGSFPRLRALWLLPLLDRPGACEDSGIPLSWSSSGQFTHSLTKLRQQVSSVRFVWGVLFHLLFPHPWAPVLGMQAMWKPSPRALPVPWWCRVCWWLSKLC